MAHSEFGEHLRREREMRGVSLEEVSGATRISITFLQALEGGRWDQLPGGVFRRGFIRSVARYLGLNEEDLITEYALETNDAPQVAVPAKAAGPDLRPLVLYGGAALAVLILALIGFFSYRHFAHRKVAKAQQAAPAASIASQSATTPAPVVPAPNAATDGSAAPGSINQANGSGTQDSPAASSAAKSGAAPASPPQQQSSAPVQRQVSTPTQSILPPALQASQLQNAQPSVNTGANVLTLQVRAQKPTHVRVLADGEEIFNDAMARGQWRNFHALESVEIFADDGSAVSLDLNGQTVKTSGAAGQPLHIVLPPSASVATP